MLRKYFPVLLFLCCYTELSFNFCFEVSFIFLTSSFEKKNFNFSAGLFSPSSYLVPPLLSLVVMNAFTRRWAQKVSRSHGLFFMWLEWCSLHSSCQAESESVGVISSTERCVYMLPFTGAAIEILPAQ